MFFDFSRHIIVDICSHYETILCLAVHGLGIDVVVVLFVLHEPSFILEHLEVFGSLFIYARVILACTFREVNLRLYDVVKAFLVVACLGTCFFGFKHVIRTRLHLFHILLWRAYALKRFYNRHRDISLP